MYGDPGELRSLARQVRAWADEVDLVAARTTSAQGVRWHSTAADRFRTTLAEQAADVRDRVEALEALAQALVAHAAAVEQQLARIAAAERLVREKVDQARRVAAGVVGTVQGWADDAVDRLGDLGDDLPRPGSVEWLDLAERVS